MREENIRIIFGLKLRQLRNEHSWSLAELSKKSGLSASYLNEIEKGKKYPKAEKIAALSQAFKVPYDEMVSLQLSKNLAPLGDLIRTGILNDLPLEMLGFNFNKLVDWMSNAPLKVGAFFKTIIEISRNYNLEKEYFYFAILRSYQENNENYFEALETLAQSFLAEYSSESIASVDEHRIREILEEDFNYKIDTFDIEKHKDLASVRSFYITSGNRKNKQAKLMLNSKASNWQKRFILTRELGFMLLKIGEQERPHLPLLLKAPSFEIVLNNYRASYFGMAILIPQQQLIHDLEALFSLEEWDTSFFRKILNKYAVSPELLLLRMTNLMPRFFGIKKLFFLRFQSKGKNKYQLTRELHLAHLHSPHGNENYLHYCRRWLGTRLLSQLEKPEANTSELPLIEAQFSHYAESNLTYFGIGLARPMLPTPNTNVSVEIGWVVDANTKSKIKFLSDPSIPVRTVNTTCEMCGIADCESRVKDPTELDKKKAFKNIKTQLKELAETLNE